MSTAADPKGLKRICLSCGTRYYDFNKRPVVCPSCSAEFKIDTKTKGRRSRVAANDEPKNTPVTAAVKLGVADEEEAAEVILDEEEDTVSLDEVEDMEEGDEDIEEDAGPDLELDEDIEDIEDLDDDDLDDDEEDDEEEES